MLRNIISTFIIIVPICLWLYCEIRSKKLYLKILSCLLCLAVFILMVGAVMSSCMVTISFYHISLIRIADRIERNEQESVLLNIRKYQHEYDADKNPRASISTVTDSS